MNEGAEELWRTKLQLDVSLVKKLNRMPLSFVSSDK